MLRIFIGYDPEETVAWHTLAHSILVRSSIPIAFAPVARAHLRAVYTRARGPTESTEFAISRFLVPYLSGYEGWSLFMDCDMLCRADIAALWSFTEAQSDKAVLVCRHDYVPKTERKFLDRPQTRYPRKNWSSLMLFNNARCRALRPEYVNRAGGLDLHRFAWLDEAEIGSLPLEWNWLVGEYPYNPDAKIVHFTIGGPWFEEYRASDYADEWFEEQRRMNHATREKQGQTRG